MIKGRGSSGWSHILFACLAVLFFWSGAAGAQTTELVSVATGGAQGDSASYNPSASFDGNRVAFDSRSSNFVTVAGDTNGSDIFIRDRGAGTTSLVSPDTGGGQANGNSENPSLSADGNWVAFDSDASDLVASDPNGNKKDIFVRDLVNNITNLVSVSTDADGANGGSYLPSISGDGRYVAFYSYATDLVASDPNGTTADVFVRDLVNGVTTLVSVSTDGNGASGSSNNPSISADGRYVSFPSWASDLVASDLNGFGDVFVRDLINGTTTLVSVDTGGGGANSDSFQPSISADGRYVAFSSYASDLVASDPNGGVQDVFVRDLWTNTTVLVSVSMDGNGANGFSYEPTISADGRYVSFVSYASDLVASDPNGGTADIFVRDLWTNTTMLVSVSTDADGANGSSYDQSIAGDGRSVAFESYATDLVPSDLNGNADIFIRSGLWGQDPDMDGVPDQEEWGPNMDDNGYDGDGNGWPDYTENGTASLFTNDGTQYVTLALDNSNGERFNNDVQAVPTPGGAPNGVSFPLGFFSYSIDIEEGACTTVTIYAPRDDVITSFWKYDGGFYEFAYDGETGAEIVHDGDETRIVIHLCDGKRGDADNAVNGTIVEPGAPAGGSAAQIPTLGQWGILMLMALLVCGGVRFMRRRKA